MKVRIIAFSGAGCRLALRVAEALKDDEVCIYSKTSGDSTGTIAVESSMRTWTGESFGAADAIVFVGAVGIAVREIAPFVKRKDIDPAVVGIDELGRFCIPLLSGHIGGANALAARIAGAVGAVPVVTTATDINGKISIDAFAVRHDLSIASLKPAKEVSARILEGDPVGLVSDVPVVGDVPSELSAGEGAPTGVYIGERGISPFPCTLTLVPRRRVVGIGCRRGTPRDAIEAAVSSVLESNGIPADSIRQCASIDLKSDEEGLLEFASSHRLPITFFSAGELNALPGEYSRSDFVRSVTDVDCVCERSAVAASRGGSLIVRKTAGNGVTVAVAEEPFAVDFGA